MPWKHFTAKWAVPKQDQYPVTCNHDKQVLQWICNSDPKAAYGSCYGDKENDQFVIELRKVRTLCCMGIQDATTIIAHSLQKFEGDPKEETTNHVFIFKGLNDSTTKFEKLEDAVVALFTKDKTILDGA
jgi:hypothetical protein